MISCQLHDYIEIACLYRYRVSLQLKNGSHVEGVAETTRTTSDKKEYLSLSTHDKTIDADFDEIRALVALTPNPHFNVVEFD
jgi:Rho-binding antiterminator